MRILFPNIILLGALALLSVPAQAASLSLGNVNRNDFDALVKEFSSNAQYSTVGAASSLGGLGNFELGVVGGITNAGDLAALVKRNGGSFEDKLYHAAGMVRIGLPYAITLEGLFFPETKISSVKLGRWGVGAQWTLTDEVLTDLPVNIAVKGYYTKTTLDYTQNTTAAVGGGTLTANVNFDNSLYGGLALVSYKIFLFEPFAGIGFMKAKGNLKVNASATTTLLNQAVFGSSADSASSDPSSVHLVLGTDFQIAFFSLGAEYSRAFDKDSMTGRLSFRF